MQDKLSEVALKIINEADFPLETKEILEKTKTLLKDATRTKLFYRLNNLRGDGLVSGRFIGPGKGVWVWWKKSAF